MSENQSYWMRWYAGVIVALAMQILVYYVFAKYWS
jgi:hypothetical protein